jgi:hypothetical protein
VSDAKESGWKWEGDLTDDWEWKCERLLSGDGSWTIIDLEDDYPGYPECGEHLIMSIAPKHARLIAAAPDLYAALKEFLDYSEGEGNPNLEDIPALRAKLRAALAKAEGKDK